MLTDLTVMLEDRPGSLAQMGEALGKAGINIEGICGVTVQGKGLIHVLVNEAAKARRALGASNIQVAEETEVVVLEIEDRPGVLGNIARRLATERVNVTLAYLATSTRLVLAVDEPEKAAGILKPRKSS
jgi:hypothetical protein